MCVYPKSQLSEIILYLIIRHNGGMGKKKLRNFLDNKRLLLFQEHCNLHMKTNLCKIYIICFSLSLTLSLTLFQGITQHLSIFIYISFLFFVLLFGRSNYTVSTRNCTIICQRLSIKHKVSWASH